MCYYWTWCMLHILRCDPWSRISHLHYMLCHQGFKFPLSCQFYISSSGVRWKRTGNLFGGWSKCMFYKDKWLWMPCKWLEWAAYFAGLCYCCHCPISFNCHTRIISFTIEAKETKQSNQHTIEDYELWFFCTISFRVSTR